MATGTIKYQVNVYKAGAGGPVMLAKPLDKVTGNVSNDAWIITKLTRNGKALALPYPVSILAAAIEPDALTPPPDPEVPPTGLQNMRLIDLDTGQSWDFVRKPNV